eukprot:scaffold1894_cov368-Prasinococcus_capsulatus_cf.AAC.8
MGLASAHGDRAPLHSYAEIAACVNIDGDFVAAPWLFRAVKTITPVGSPTIASAKRVREPSGRARSTTRRRKCSAGRACLCRVARNRGVCNALHAGYGRLDLRKTRGICSFGSISAALRSRRLGAGFRSGLTLATRTTAAHAGTPRALLCLQRPSARVPPAARRRRGVAPPQRLAAAISAAAAAAARVDGCAASAAELLSEHCSHRIGIEGLPG